MTTVDDLLDGSTPIKDSARDFIRDPLEFFDMSYTKMHSLPRELLEDLQTEALSLRFEQQKDRIPTLKKLADRQGITGIGKVEEVLPVLFEHTIYKSYPNYLLETGQYDKLTTWLDRLTPYDLGHLDTSGCSTIHSWLDLIVSETEIDPIGSSGTTGTMSFTPLHRSDWRTRTLGCFRIQLLQKFGAPPTEADLNDPVHVFWPSHADGHQGLFRSGQYFKEVFAMGDDAYFHPVYNSVGDTDVMYLAARLRAAQARGGSQIDVPQSLLDRRSEIGKLERERAASVGAWKDALLSLKGERVFLMGMPPLIYDVAVAGLAEGQTCDFAPDSAIQVGSGGKGIVMPDDWEDVAKGFINFKGDYGYYYGFSEQTVIAVRCRNGRLHLPPWSMPLILDPDTNALLPREGVQAGKAAYFDLAVNGVWGGLITGDKVEVDWSLCGCGQTTVHLSQEVSRLSEEQGGTDKISCTATPEAQEEAMEFLSSL